MEEMRRRLQETLDLLIKIESEFDRPVANPLIVMMAVSDAMDRLEEIGGTANIVAESLGLIPLADDCGNPLCPVHGGSQSAHLN